MANCCDYYVFVYREYTGEEYEREYMGIQGFACVYRGIYEYTGVSIGKTVGISTIYVPIHNVPTTALLRTAGQRQRGHFVLRPTSSTGHWRSNINNGAGLLFSNFCVYNSSPDFPLSYVSDVQT